MQGAGGQRQARDVPSPPPDHRLPSRSVHLTSSPSSRLSPPPSSSLPVSSSPLLPASSSILSLPGDPASRFEPCGGAVFPDNLVQESGSPCRAERSGGPFSAEDVRRIRTGDDGCLAFNCAGPQLHGHPSTSKGFEREPGHDHDLLFPSPVDDVYRKPCHHLVSCPRKSSSLWSAQGSGDRGTWTQPVCGKVCVVAQHRPCPRSGGRGQTGGMSRLSIRRCRQWLGVGLPLAVFLYIVLCCNSALWTSFSLQHHPLPNTLPGSGFRKLLEEQEKARLSVNVSQTGLVQRLPSCIIIGVRKCGTRALLEFLDLHPDIVTAEDEMHFFNDDQRYRLGLEWYRHLMPLSLPHQITMEKTPGYFISPIAPRRVHRMNSSIKLLVLLRHPTTRTISDYTQIYYNKLSKNESLDAFEDIVIDRDSGLVNTRYKAVQISMYHHHFRHWADVFPPHQIHVVDGDRLITNPVSEIREIERFLGLQHRIDYDLLYYNSTRGFYCMHLNATCEKCLGASKGRKHPTIEASVVKKLNKFFEPHNKQLFDLIGRQFPWS